MLAIEPSILGVRNKTSLGNMSSQGVMPFGSKDRGEAGDVLIKVVSSVLEELIATPPPYGDEAPPITKFHGLRAPSIAVSDYLVRISKFSGCSVG